MAAVKCGKINSPIHKLTQQRTTYKMTEKMIILFSLICELKFSLSYSCDQWTIYAESYLCILSTTEGVCMKESWTPVHSIV